MNKFSLQRTLAVALLATSLLLPRISQAAGNDNPTGPTGEYNGSITTAGSYDPYTGNAKRFVDDLMVTGSVGAYPLKWTRILNTRQGSTAGFGDGGAWTHSYRWGLWVSGYQPYEYHDEQYDLESPDGVVTYPDGRTMELEANPDGTYFQKRGVEPLGRIQNMPGGNYDLILPDGGRVKFEHLPGTSGGYSLVATKIVDPHGQTTTIERDSAGRLSRITEPAGRYLQINYTTFSYPSTVIATGGTVYVDVISSVQAFASAGNLTETVNYSYTYETVDYYREYNLTQVRYDDGTQATYTYFPNNGPNGIAGGRMETCRDVRYAGAMSNIKYEYAVWSTTHRVAVGQVWREKNLTTDQVVSEVTYPPTHPESNDPSRFVRTERRGDGATRSFQYSIAGGELESYTDFKNQRSYIGYALASGGINYLRVFTDARGNRTSTEKERTAGAVMAVFHHDGPPTRYIYSDPNNPYYVVSETNALGKVTYYDRDATNRIWRTRYPDGGVEQFTYNGFGQVLTHRMTSGGWETVTYDSRGLKTSSFPPATPSDPYPSTHPTRYNYYQSGPHTDRLLSVVDPRGNATSYEYNLRGQVTKITHQNGSYTQSQYNPDGTLAWSADENHPNASWNMNERTRYTYDEYKRVLTVTNPMNETTTNSYALDWQNSLIHTTGSVKYTLSPMGKNVVFDYDANFRKEYQTVAMQTPDQAVTKFEYDAVGNLIKTTDPRWNVTTFDYDNRNRQVTVTDALNHTTTTAYDMANNKTSVTRHGNPPLQFVEYDSMNRLTHKIDERGYRSYMRYNYAGNLIWQKDENGNIYQYGYDQLNRKTSMTYPRPSSQATVPVETWRYDEVGNIKTYTNRAGAVQTYALPDNRNRPTSFTWSDGTPGQSFAYDAKSRLKRTYNAEADISFGYDDADRKTSETETVYSFGLNRATTIAYQYDQDGNRKRIIYPAGYQFIYAYTQRNQLANIKLDPAIYGGGYETPVVAYAYDESGNRSLRTLLKGASTPNAGPGASTQYAMDEVNRVYSQSTYFANNRVGRFDYGFDALNRRKYEQRDSGPADGFQYDPTDQVTGYQKEGTLNTDGTVSSAITGTLSLDGAGNRTQITGSFESNTYIPNALNQYTSDAGGPAGYDNNGNLTSYGGWTVTYDAVNRLTELRHPGTGQQISYRYDVLNRRIAQKANGVVTSYVYDNWNLIEERPTDGRQPHCYLFGGSVNELVVSFGSGYQNYWYFQDGRGNTSHLTDNEHAVIERYTYSFDGRVSYFNGSNPIDGSSVDNRFLFAGAILLPETQLYDMRHRIYYPRWGRFLQTDPIGFKGDSANLYRYCGNDSVNRSDPMGLSDHIEPSPLLPEWMNEWIVHRIYHSFYPTPPPTYRFVIYEDISAGASIMDARASASAEAIFPPTPAEFEGESHNANGTKLFTGWLSPSGSGGGAFDYVGYSLPTAIAGAINAINAYAQAHGPGTGEITVTQGTRVVAQGFVGERPTFDAYGSTTVAAAAWESSWGNGGWHATHPNLGR